MLNLTRPLCRAIKSNLNMTKVTAASQGGSSKKPAVRPEFEKMRKLQEHFQKKDGLPVFLKQGARDQLLYRTTMALAIIGLLLNVQMYIVMAL